VVISEFRTRGPNGDNDEFVELYNPTGAAVNIGSWTIKRSADCGPVVISPLATLAANTILQAGQHYLLVTTTSTSVTGQDQTFAAGQFLTDSGGLALVDTGGNVIDAVGMCISTFYREGTNLDPLSGNVDQSYERRPGGATACYDTENNASDFVLISPSNPQNRSTPITLCGGIVTSTPTLTKTLTLTRTSTLTRTPTRTATTIPGFVVINEFLPHPHSDWNDDGSVNTGDEYIELLNMGTASINIKNWKLDNGANTQAYVLPDITLLPHQILVFFHFETNLPLSDGGGTVRLVKSDGRTADIFNYPPVEALDRTWCRLESGRGFLNFACPPTPGRPNIPVNPTPAMTATRTETSEKSKCTLGDTVPPEKATAACNGGGAEISNSSPGNQFWLPNHLKWRVFVE